MDDPTAVPRREFIVKAAASSLFLALHDSIASAGQSVRSVPGDETSERIVSLRLLTQAPLGRMKAFYRDGLGMRVLRESKRELTVAAGTTALTFVTADGKRDAPFYHFAFNIPEQKILAARKWQLERTPIFDAPENLRDPSYPTDVRHFRSWNAHSVFFFDPAENVLEYIARHDLPATRRMGTEGGDFSAGDVLYASEIALVVDDVSTAADGLTAGLGLRQYRGGSDQFRAIGDERGLLLVFARGRSLGSGSGTSKGGAVFPTEATVRATARREHEVVGYPYRIVTA